MTWLLKALPFAISNWKWLTVLAIAIFLGGYNVYLRREVLKERILVSQKQVIISDLKAAINVQNASIRALNAKYEAQKVRVAEASLRSKHALTRAQNRASEARLRASNSKSVLESVLNTFTDLSDVDWRQP